MKQLSYVISILLTFSVTVIAQVNLTDGLIYYFDFENSYKDLQSNTATTVYGNLVLVPNDSLSFSNNALDLSGEGTFLALDHSASFNPQNDFSISLWLSLPEEQVVLTSGGNAILSKWAFENGFNPNDGYPFALRINNSKSSDNGKIKFLEYDSKLSGCENVSVITSTKTYNDNVFHHIVFGKQGDTLKLYIDCKLVGTLESKAECSIANDAKIFVGARNESSPMYFPNNLTGILDELRFYNRFLTEKEINLLCEKITNNTEDEDSDDNQVEEENPIQTCFDFNIKPNPFCDHINVEYQDDAILTVFDINGRLVYNGLAISFNPSKLSQSIYYLKVDDCDDFQKVIKICK